MNNAMMDAAKRIFPICRSLTGNGVRETFHILKEYCPLLELHEVPCGTKVMDWEVPDEWNIEEGYIEDELGIKVLDFKENNLHIMGYSAPMDQWMTWDELKDYVHTIPAQPDWIPYVTSYYKRRSGFCMSENHWKSLDHSKIYHAVIKSSFRKDGSMTYGELLIPGELKQEIFLTTYICHPSMGNNECSGPVVLTWLANKILENRNRKYSYRIVFAPETIGAIAYLSRNLNYMKKNVTAGYIITCVGDNMEYSMVHSRYGNNLAEKVLKNILEFEVPHYKEYSFLQRGSDERQYCAPGVDLPVCTFCRTKFYEYPEYHTSADNLEIISENGLRGALHVLEQCINVIESNNIYIINCLCEPQLGKRGLYPTLSKKGNYDKIRKLQNVLMYTDGSNDLLDISNLVHLPVREVIIIIQKLKEAGLISSVDKEG